MGIEQNVYDDVSSGLRWAETKEQTEVSWKELLEMFISADWISVWNEDDYNKFKDISSMLWRKIQVMDKNFKTNYIDWKFPSWNSISKTASKTVPGYKWLVMRVPANTSKENRARIARVNKYGGTMAEKEMQDMKREFNILQVMAETEDWELVPVMSYTLTTGQAMDWNLFRQMPIDTSRVNPRWAWEIEMAEAMHAKEMDIAEKTKWPELKKSRQERERLQRDSKNILSNQQMDKAASFYRRFSVGRNKNLWVEGIQKKLVEHWLLIDIDWFIWRQTIWAIAKFQMDKWIEPIDWMAWADTLIKLGLIEDKKQVKEFYSK